jgi:phosphoribosylformylglycinamidine synthase II
VGAPLHVRLGLTDDEAERICSILGREPNRLELAMYAVMWSEHCSYKSSRHHLRRLPSEGSGVLAGPGENAGVLDVGGGVAVAVRIESHNHPSAVEPRQGAATGVGGIVRDVLAVGARPMALLDSLRFGPLEDPRNRYLLEGVVAGISAYGNSVGVPTVGGELELAGGFAGNPLVNVMCLGLLPSEGLVRARASGVGNLAVLLGAPTGRDGIGGVSVLASSGFGPEPGPDMRPSVQVGDPFEEKRLIEACLELVELGVVVGLQDLGGAGLTCAASETAARAGLGMDLDLSAVPLREPGMEPFEVMTSESQERMLAIVAPGDLDQVLAVCRRWEVSAAPVGRVTPPEEGVGRLRVLERAGGPVLADVPAASLSDGAPCYDRPASPPASPPPEGRRRPAGAEELRRALACMLGAPDLADRGWVASQYDHQLFLNTVVGPGGDAAVLRLAAPGLPEAPGGLAVSVDGNSRWCATDPRAGTQMVLAEATLNVACAGARPVAVVDCLNLGNPEHPEVMWQLAGVVDGLAEGCRALGLPVVGGNVSLYNETAGRDIAPTPVVGVVGVIERLERPPPRPGLLPGRHVVVLGPPAGSLAGSRRAAATGRPSRLPRVDFAGHRRVLELVADLCRPTGPPGLVEGVHDVSDGGLALALAEMALASGVGVRARLPRGDPEAQLFSESASRVLVCTPAAEQVLARASRAGVAAFVLGRAGGDRLAFDGLFELGLDEVATRWETGLSRWFDP